MCIVGLAQGIAVFHSETAIEIDPDRCSPSVSDSMNTIHMEYSWYLKGVRMEAVRTTGYLHEL
jgi:hypothetical protein